MSDSFDGIDPKDGFHVVRVDSGNQAELFFQVYSKGVMYEGEFREAVPLFRARLDQPEATGRLIRIHLVLRAVVRYLTTGGNWAELDRSLVEIAEACEGTGLSRRTAGASRAAAVFPGYFLLDSYCTTEGSFQHVFAAESTDEAILWEEPQQNTSGGLYGGFIDRTTLDEIRRQQLEEEDEDAARLQAEIDAEYPDPGAGTAPDESPDRRRLGPAEEVAGDPDA